MLDCAFPFSVASVASQQTALNSTLDASNTEAQLKYRVFFTGFTVSLGESNSR